MNKELYAIIVAISVVGIASAMEPVGLGPVETPSYINAGYDASVQALAEGKDVVSVDKRGLTSLHYAAAKGDLEMMVRLIDMNVPLNAQAIGLTPLHYAVKYGQREAAGLLVAYGAEKDVKTTLFGYTPLYSAVQDGQKNLVHFLIEEGADVTVPTVKGWTPLHEAAYRGYAGLAEVLVHKGASLDALTNKGETPLRLAIKGGKLQAILCLAVLKGYKPVVEALVKAGLSQEDILKAYELASNQGQTAIATVLADYIN